MKRLVFAVAFLTVVALVPAGRAAAQEGAASAALTIDDNLVKKGKSLWSSRACSGCHTIGKGKMAGPDLAHITDRRSVEWVQKWLMNTASMLESDETAKALVAEYNGVKMPDFKLKEDDAQSLIHYIAKESEKVKKK